jgi:hypothetical protein
MEKLVKKDLCAICAALSIQKTAKNSEMATKILDFLIKQANDKDF